MLPNYLTNFLSHSFFDDPFISDFRKSKQIADYHQSLYPFVFDGIDFCFVENFLFETTDINSDLKIIDFGLSKIIKNKEAV